MPPRRTTTTAATTTTSKLELTDDSVIAAEVWVPKGVYTVAIAVNENLDQHNIFFTPSSAWDSEGEFVGNLADAKLIQGTVTLDNALSILANKVADDMAKTPKTPTELAAPSKKATATKATAKKTTGATKTTTAKRSASAEVDVEAPYGYKADGTPKARPGRKPASESAAPAKKVAAKRTVAPAKKASGARKGVGRPSARARA